MRAYPLTRANLCLDNGDYSAGLLFYAMKIYCAYKTELDPNNTQRTLFVQSCGVARFVYNWALADRIERYEHGEQTSLYEQKRRFNALKKAEYPWLEGIAYQVTGSAFCNLDTAYQNFFRRVKQGKEKIGFPRFKSRKHGLGSFTVRGALHVETNRVKMPIIGWVRLKERGYLPSSDVKILSMTISEQAHHWFVSVQVEQEVPEPKPASNKLLGVDVGLRSLAVVSNGKVFDNPKTTTKYEKRLAYLQRELCRRKKGGKNREKSKQKIARLHFKIANVRKHALHQVSDYVTAKTKPSVVVLEDLNVKGMMANHCLAKSLADASFAELSRQIQYKAQWQGIEVVLAGRFYPSSKLCSACGEKKPYLKLSERTFVCPSCGNIIDRDLNAALNLAALVNRETHGDCLGSRNGTTLRCELRTEQTLEH